MHRTVFISSTVLVFLCVSAMGASADEAIKAFCVDFNWGRGGDNAFAGPGHWADADPEEHVAWYEALGANTIQTFAVSCNGYAWYKGGIVPEQPGLKHNFLTEMVKLGHARDMRVMGYFCVGSNTRWGKKNPEHSYGAPSSTHLVLSDVYLDFLAASIQDALKVSGMDGFMIDWVFNPDGCGDGRATHSKGKWLDEEKKLYQQLMDEPFPGEDTLTPEKKIAYDRRAVARCWKRIHAAAKSAKPDCIIWLSCYDLSHPSVVDSDLFKEVDWLMNEDPDPKRLAKVLGGKPSPQQSVLQCLVGWGDKHDARAVVTNPDVKVRHFYGFAKPGRSSLPLPIAKYLAKPIDSFKGNDKNIAVLARYYNGKL